MYNAQHSLSKDKKSKKNVSVADRIIDVEEGLWSILIGTVVKEMDPKRRLAMPQLSSSSHDASMTHDAQSFLFSFNGDKGEKHREPWLSHLFDSEKGDVLYLEDESGRVEIVPDEGENATGAMNVDGSSLIKSNSHALDPNRLATGMVAAVVGKVCATKGVMRVSSIHFAGPPPSSETPADNGELVLRGPLINGKEASSGDIASIEPVLLLVSGLGCGSDSSSDIKTGASLALRREMLLEYLVDPTAASDLSIGGGASVCRVIVAGGGVSSSAQATTLEECSNKENNNNQSVSSISYDSIAKSNNSKRASSSTAVANHVTFSLRELDLYLAEMLGSGIPVDYVPGWHDQTNANWPQRPIHSCLFPLSCEYVDLFGRSTNPYEAILGGVGLGNGDEESVQDGGSEVRVLGSDGLNVADLRRFLADNTAEAKEGDHESGGEEGCAASCLDALNLSLKCGHMAPTGPDSLPTGKPTAGSLKCSGFCFFCSSFISYALAYFFASTLNSIVPSSTDPFILPHRPDVYFAGNCDKFETRLVDGNGDEIAKGGLAHGNNLTRLVCVPSFAKTGEVVLVKLQSLECEVVSFDDASLMMK